MKILSLTLSTVFFACAAPRQVREPHNAPNVETSNVNEQGHVNEVGPATSAGTNTAQGAAHSPTEPTSLPAQNTTPEEPSNGKAQPTTEPSAETQETNCEKAYKEQVAIYESLKVWERENAAAFTRPGAKVLPEKIELPSREKYLNACNAKSEAFQRCLGCQYGAEHRDECRVVATPEKLYAFKRDLMSSNEGTSHKPTKGSAATGSKPMPPQPSRPAPAFSEPPLQVHLHESAARK